MNKPAKATLKIGLIINPFAGIGGKVGLKGSDGQEIRQEAFARGAIQQSENRAKLALEAINSSSLVQWVTASGAMGAALLAELGFKHQVIYQSNEPSQSTDTLSVANLMLEHDIDLLVFAGGDGTARNICQVIQDKIPVIGIPAGVKIHSGVYAITPQAAGELLNSLINNELVSLIEASVMDIDEDEFREGRVKAKKYGEMLIPAEHQYMQSTKVSSSQLNREQESVVLQDITEFIIDNMDDDTHYLIGSGTSCAALMDELQLDNTLLGVDWVYQNKLYGSDLNESDILKVIEKNPNKVQVIITVIGGQGHIFGRGNQQFSAAVLEQLSKDSITIIATKTKINQLQARPLIVDTDDPSVNQLFSGTMPILTGYDDRILYQVGFQSNL